MFYCDECAHKKGWPVSWSRSWGPCEVCKKEARCNDVPSRALPPAKVRPRPKPAASETKTLSNIVQRRLGAPPGDGDEGLEGRRVRMTGEMPDDPDPIKVGDVGTVQYVDGAGTLQVKWDSGRNLGLLMPQDEGLFEFIEYLQKGTIIRRLRDDQVFLVERINDDEFLALSADVLFNEEAAPWSGPSGQLILGVTYEYTSLSPEKEAPSNASQD